MYKDGRKHSRTLHFVLFNFTSKSPCDNSVGLLLTPLCEVFFLTNHNVASGKSEDTFVEI